ncbi:hypothetical protein A2115_03295 [Candidatus Woesebacteria bacterium GWA1_41_8]|uniref:HD domain-containing protein n=1 Tax=Candidatus Woesebacteria bacterium GWA1_41_8 TaxID=1802471 RepID=A0A1F7WJM3_9BACT|nr:MAG: hypothetical protein A2115_03295 [Candidatus Woesebacteria bacterium GWA1_41_8]
MKLDLPEPVDYILEEFEKSGFEIYIVGGAVRDLVMGKILYDWDFTTNATPEEMLKLFPEAYYTNEFGMVGIPNDPRPFEITTFRTEHGYSDSRRPDKVSWGKSLKEDLKRRDFTINAMALRKSDKNTYELIDHFKGKSDLAKKLVRAVGDPQERFSEDALRMMRAVRIAAELDFKIEEKTLNAIQANAKTIERISKERVRDELLKTLASAHPYEGIILLRESNLLEELIPELEKTFGVEQKSPGRHHIYDVGTHSLMALKYCPSTDPVVRFATLIHDIGKPQTFKKMPNGTLTFYNHELVSTRIAKRISERLKFSKKQSDKLIKLVRWHQFTVDEHQTDSALRRFIRHVSTDYLADMLDLRVGDRLGGGATETSWRLEEFKKRLVEVQKQPFSITDLKIDGKDVMQELNINPGPTVGQVLKTVFEEVVDKKLPNEKKDLLARLKSFKSN